MTPGPHPPQIPVAAGPSRPRARPGSVHATRRRCGTRAGSPPSNPTRVSGGELGDRCPPRCAGKPDRHDGPPPQRRRLAAAIGGPATVLGERVRQRRRLRAAAASAGSPARSARRHPIPRRPPARSATLRGAGGGSGGMRPPRAGGAGRLRRSTAASRAAIRPAEQQQRPRSDARPRTRNGPTPPTGGRLAGCRASSSSASDPREVRQQREEDRVQEGPADRGHHQVGPHPAEPLVIEHPAAGEHDQAADEATPRSRPAPASADSRSPA